MKQPFPSTQASSATRPSLRRLAEIAGVDVSTISRALHGDPRISDRRMAAIRDIARREGYRPQPLRTRRTGAIGIVLASESREHIGGAGEHFLQRIAWIASRQLAARDLHANLECVLRDADEDAPAIVHENRVDGVLVAGHPRASLVRRIVELGLPVVAINDASARLGVPCVSSDPSDAVREAVETLARLGHRRFALLLNDLDRPTSRARHEAFRGALSALGLPVRDDWILANLPGEIPAGREGVERLWSSRGARPTALLCCNDWVALGALFALLKRGIDVPGRVSVVGHDDVGFATTLDPPLTTIARPEETIVSEALRLLLDAGARPSAAPAADILVPGHVVWRGTTGPSPRPNRPRTSPK